MNIFITGANSGIGLALTHALLREGHQVWASDIELGSLEQLTGNIHCHRLDVRDEAAWAAWLGSAAVRVDALINNAGVLRSSWVDEASSADVDFHLDVNTKGMILGTQAAVRRMKTQTLGSNGRRGQIINVASLAGIAPGPGLSLYCASKFAIRGYTLSVAHELKAMNIGITALCPDATETPMLVQQQSDERAALTFSGLRTLQTPDIVDAVLRRALPHAPVEIMLPGWRGWLAKFGNSFPSFSDGLYSFFMARGRKVQAARTAR
jgi:3-oxoacyl-[acyl-carrier protein] reductase